MNAVIVQKSCLRNCPLGTRTAFVAFFERLVGDLLQRFEAVPFGALVFV
jgi:hypothetical protein